MEQTDISSLDSSQITDVGALETVNNAQEGLYRLKNSPLQFPHAKAIVKLTNGQTVYTFAAVKLKVEQRCIQLTAADFAHAWQRAVNPATKAADAYMFLPIQNAKQIGRRNPLSVSNLGVKSS